MRIEDTETNSFMIINGDTVYQKDFTSGKEFRYVIGENQKNLETEEFYYYIESFIQESNLEISGDPSILGMNKWEITGYPKEEYPKAYESIAIKVDTCCRVIEGEIYHFPVNDEIGDKIVTHENILSQNGIYYPLKTTKTEDFQEKGILKAEMVWTNINFNQVIAETYFDIPEE